MQMQFLASMLALVLASSTAPSAVAPPIRYGAGDHPIKRSSERDEPTFRELCRRNLTVYRIDIPLTADTEPYAASRLETLVKRAKSCNIRIVAMLQTGFAWGDRTDAGRYPKGDTDALYRQGYDRTLPFVQRFRDAPIDWELGNELNLLRVDETGAPLFGRGWSAAEFDTPLLGDWATVLKGMSDAVEAAGEGKLRRVLNTTSTNFGFLDFMADRGVGFELIDYHYYERRGTSPRALAYGNGRTYDLFAKLATYRRPVIVGEINGAEIYDAHYRDRLDDRLTIDGFHSLKDAIAQFAGQSDIRVEAIIVYEMWDEGHKPPPENRFGLLRENGSPRLSLSILTRFAKGALAPSEQAALAALDLHPD